MITGFNHSGFVVQDIEAMVRFYRDTLGLTVLREAETRAPAEGDHTGIPGAHRYLVFVGPPEAEHALELVHYISPPSPPPGPGGRPRQSQIGAAHVAFNVEGIHDLHQRLSAAGVRFVTPPVRQTRPEGGGFIICYAQDPEGNWLEFLEPLP